MIRVKKPAEGPAILFKPKSRGAIESRKLKNAYARGKRSFEFDSAIYRNASVKQALRKAQFDKCCFCESKITHISYGDVEHFRPKAGYRQNPGDPLTTPGYYWLAYDWANLCLCCQLCNQRHKGNLFPLIRTGQRAKYHHNSVSHERPLFLDPTQDDPAKFIGFREEYAYAINGNRRARTTIEALGLNREKLVEVRRDRLAPIQLLAEKAGRLAGRATAKDKTLLGKLRAHFEKVRQDSAEYSAMIRAALQSVRL